MISISETTAPIFSYKNIIQSPLIQNIAMRLISELSIEDTNKKKIVKEFASVTENFEDFSYTGDINDFKFNIYTALSDIPDDARLLDIISTEEFIEKITNEVEESVSILLDNEKKVSLTEYLQTLRSKGKVKNILPVLRGLYSFDSNRNIHPDASELMAAIKKHIATTTTNSSIQELLSLVEEKKQNKLSMRTDEGHYHNIKSYTEVLDSQGISSRSNDYITMLDKVMIALEYFTNSDSYKKEKLDKLMYDFLDGLIKNGLSKYQKKYGYIGNDVFSVEFKEKMNIKYLMILLNKNSEYKDYASNIINNETIKLQKEITDGEKYIENFNRPTREERYARAPYRGAPIKSDQEYQRELGNAKLELEMDKKNLALMNDYKLAIDK